MLSIFHVSFTSLDDLKEFSELNKSSVIIIDLLDYSLNLLSIID